MARAWIQLPYDQEAGRTPWAPAARIMAAVERLRYGVERHVYPGNRREVLRLSAAGDMKKPPT